MVSKSQEENGDSKAVPETLPAAGSVGDPGELRNSDAALPTVANSPVSMLYAPVLCDAQMCITPHPYYSTYNNFFCLLAPPPSGY